MRLLVRLAVAAVAILGATAAVGLWLGGDDGDRRAGLPPPDETVATLLDDGTPVFVTRRADESVAVVDARTPPRTVRGDDADVVAPADLLDGLVAWCPGEGFVDDLAPPATFALDGRATGATREGLGVYDITAQERGHVLVGTAEPAGRADAAAPGCGDLADAEHHGRVMREVDLDALPSDSSWVVEAAVDLAGGVVCAPPDDPLVWPLCPDGGIDAEVGDHTPGGEQVDGLVAEHGRDYAERGAYGFVGRFLVAREEDGGPLTQVWRLPGEVRLRGQPETVEVEATVAVGDGEPASTLRLTDVEGGAVPHTALVTATTTVAADGEQADGEQGAELLRAALADDGDRRWRLTLLREPLAGSVRLEHVEARER